MDIISYSAARSSLADIMDRVVNNHEPVIITRGRKQAVIMLSLKDYKAMKETAYLLRNTKNAQRLLQSIAQLEFGRGNTRELSE
ncbi:type II toxin-antitoxin system prevent-host-death family antitoxin [uncultured Xanthomonas sp.]|uniref:type II toxin-antitoxin system Phd/YefM family antitoxin n=1 Tax=uncultured Xanthomonas sp. TaxID=152831 RepID=UPI0025F43C59|nr:type II toxin-antitoxin system prevent-host-death family antitoxin [uncultured Xanthomonas sp.]